MKVCVGIPSYNEADRISFVVSQIDKGLKLLRENFPQINDCVILSADSCSSDDTIKRFDNTDTLFIKDSVLTKGEPGKGKNVLAILKYALENSCDVVLTIDADLESITPDWMLKFAELVINKKVDFVYPEYKRNRFEGSTTNHLAYPLIYAHFGKDIRQPIGGDFAMSAKYAEYILNQQVPMDAYKYGIDIFLSMNAAVGKFIVRPAQLGKKIHKPSFPRMREMFPQVASSALETLLLHKRSSKFDDIDKLDVNIIDKSIFAHSKEAEIVLKEELDKLSKSFLGSLIWLSEDTLFDLQSILPKNYLRFDSDQWVKVLGDWISFAVNDSEIDIQKHSDELSSFFVIRAVNFWNESKNKTANWVENEIRMQALSLKKYFDHK